MHQKFGLECFYTLKIIYLGLLEKLNGIGVFFHTPNCLWDSLSPNQWRKMRHLYAYYANHESR